MLVSVVHDSLSLVTSSGLRSSATIKLRCHYPAEEETFFTAIIKPVDYIADLRNVIHQELGRLGRDVLLNDLRLYKVRIAHLLWIQLTQS